MRGFHREPRRVVAIKSTKGQFFPIRPARAGCFLGLIALFIVGSSVCCADSVCIETVSARPSVRLSMPHYTLDGDRETFWAAQNFQGHSSHLPSGYKDPDRQWVTYGLNREAEIDKIGILWGSDYSVTFEIHVSPDGNSWKQVFKSKSHEKKDEWQKCTFAPVACRFIRLVVIGGRKNNWLRVREIVIDDLPYRPNPKTQLLYQRHPSGVPSDQYLADRKPAQPLSYGKMAETCIENLIRHGTDRYGKINAPIWVLNLDLQSKQCFARYNDTLEDRAAVGISYSVTAPYGTGHRAIRTSQREPGCSNLFVDQPMIRAALLWDRLHNRDHFTPNVNQYIRWYFDNLVSAKTGLLDWGVHISYDVFAEHIRHADGLQHEVQAILPVWPAFHAADAKATGDYLEKFWSLHTDAKTGIVDRHPTRGRGLDFCMAAGETILVCAYLHEQDPEGPWLKRALQIAHSHYDSRDRKTNLFVNTVHGGNGKRFDNTFSDTTVCGLWASRVMIAGRITGDAELTEMARQTLLAWARNGWDEKNKKPWASLYPDGRPNEKPRNYAGNSYDKFDPSGHWDPWMDYLYGFEAPFATLMTYAIASQWFDDPEIKTHARRLAGYYRRLLPANGRVGTFAGNYGQLISFFLAMEQATGDKSYGKTARRVADEAAGHLWTGEMFRGFAGRGHYTALEGIGYLAQALIELDADPKRLAELRRNNPFFWNL